MQESLAPPTPWPHADLILARPLDWDRDSVGWPNREATRLVESGGIRWLVQQAGEGPCVLLLHGAGAATHSFGGLLPRLAERFTVVAIDLPGHGFTRVPPTFRPTLPAVAGAIAALLRVLDVAPALGVGHSAGAAILARMAIDQLIRPRALVSINGAFLPFGGIAGQVLSPFAKLLAANPFVPRLVAWRAGEPAVIDRLLRTTGSEISAEGAEIYRRLAGNAAHVAGVLDMTSKWNLRPLERDLRRLPVPLTLIVTAGDKTVPPSVSFRVRDLVPDGEVVFLRALGHLAHEERPDKIADIILRTARTHGVIGEGLA